MFFTFHFTRIKNLNNYRNIVETLDSINSSEFEGLLKNNSNDIYIYFGRETCPACIEFINQKSTQTFFEKNSIYYINTEDTEYDDELKSIRLKYDIEFVPSILHKEDGKINKIDINNI